MAVLLDGADNRNCRHELVFACTKGHVDQRTGTAFIGGCRFATIGDLGDDFADEAADGGVEVFLGHLRESCVVPGSESRTELGLASPSPGIWL